ncbi:hypothetical protein [Streptomyces sp. HSG2]
MAGVEVAADVVGLLLSAVEEASGFAGEVVDRTGPGRRGLARVPQLM